MDIILMKAVVWTQYGPPEVLRLAEVAKPAPKDGEVLIKIYATTVTAGDCELRQLKIPLLFRLPMRLFAGVRKPIRITILGQELAGEVEATGKVVRGFKKGDRVFGTTGTSFGAYAEYACLPEKRRGGVLATIPAGLTYDEAAAVPVGGMEALHFLRKGNVGCGQKVLINGAGGSIGTFAVQLAKHFGAEVTGVDSGGKLDMLRSIGPDYVIDYAREDFTKNGEAYDVIFDVAGKSPFSRSLRSLKPGGRYLLANPRLSEMIRGRWARLCGGRKVVTGGSKYRTEDLQYLRGLIEAGAIRPVVDRRYPLEQMADAHRYVETGQKKGSVVIVVNR
jgi:NADPH:quinone reductase-like Zn-dependent oxidoreductase